MAISPSDSSPNALQAYDFASFVRAANQIRYSPVADILFIYHDTLQPGFTVEPGGCAAYRVSSDRTRLVALEIHNFKSIVLKENAALANAWHVYSSPLRRMLHSTGRAKQFILDCLASLVRRPENEQLPHRLAI